MTNMDIKHYYTSNFIDSQEIKWDVEMWSIKGSENIFLLIGSYPIAKEYTLEFSGLVELIAFMNDMQYLPQDLKNFCIKIYKNRAFL